MARVVPVETAEEERAFRDVRRLLDRKRNPYWRHGEYKLFVAERDGKVEGRVAAVFDASRIDPERLGFIAFFETEASKTVAAALLNAARWWLGERGVVTVRGPIEPSLFGGAGVAVDSPLVELFSAAGWRKAYDRYRYAADVSSLKVAGRARGARVRVRPVERKRFDADADAMWWMYHAGWRRNRDFAAVTRDEFFARTAEWRRWMVPELTLVGEVGAEPAGFVVTVAEPDGWWARALPDRKRVRVAAFGVREGFRASGVAAAMAARWVETARELGVEQVDCGWVGEERTAAWRWVEAMGARRVGVSRVFES